MDQEYWAPVKKWTGRNRGSSGDPLEWSVPEITFWGYERKGSLLPSLDAKDKTESPARLRRVELVEKSVEKRVKHNLTAKKV